MLRDSGIEFGQFVDQIVERRSEIVANLPNQNGDYYGYADPQGNVRMNFNFISTCFCLLDNNTIFLARQRSEVAPKITKVFICPVDPFDGAVEYVKCHGSSTLAFI